MKPERARRFITFACVLALSALGLMVWSLFDPRPMPVIGAMSVGQVLGSLSLGIFLLVVWGDLGPSFRQAFGRGSSIPPRKAS